MTTESKPRAPSGLMARGRRFWHTTLDDYELTDAELSILTEACRTMDDLDRLAAVIKTDGATTTGSQGQTVVHPALTEVRGQRATLHRLLGALGLEDAETGAPTVRTATQTANKANAATRWRNRTGVA